MQGFCIDLPVFWILRREKKGRCYIIIKKNKFFAMMQSAKTSVFDDVSYQNILNENKKQADSVMPNPPLGVIFIVILT